MSKIFIIPLFFFVLIFQSAQARVSESMVSLEARLLGSKMGFRYGRLDSLAILEKTRNRALLNYFISSEAEFEHVIYFKRADGKKARSSDTKDVVQKDKKGNVRVVLPKQGWHVHVVYSKGFSVCEFYQKLGSSLSDYERDQLLLRQAQQAGKTHWLKPEKEEKEDDTVINYVYETSNQALRAYVKSPTAIFIRKAVDQAFSKKKDDADSEKNKTDEEAATGSIGGF